MARRESTVVCKTCGEPFTHRQSTQTFCSYRCFIGFREAKTPERFWSKVIKAGPDECWLWTAVLTHNGYGHFGVKGRMRLAHRFAWEMENGPIPPGMRALHRCDVRRCVNARHIFIGSDADNSADMVAKGRSIRGEAHRFSKLRNEDVIAIRNATGTQKSIASRFGITRSAVAAIRRRENWAHL